MVGLVHQWYADPDAAYGSLVAVAALVALRQRWSRLQLLRIEGSWWGAAAIAGASALYVVAALAADVFLLRASGVAWCAGALWFVCGPAHVRTLAAPLVLAFAAIPLPAAVVTQLTMPLQLAASQGAAGLLALIGIDVMRDGNLLTTNYVALEVAEACSGMRSIVTLLALVAIYWGTTAARTRRTLLLLVATVPIALAGNSLRVAATAVLAMRIGEDATRGLVHDATGFAAFVVMCSVLTVLHWFAARRPGIREADA